jgi:hypothetical protein
MAGMSLTVGQVMNTMFIPPGPPDGPKGTVWLKVYFWLTGPISSVNEHSFTRNYNRLILAEVIRRKWDPKFKVRGLSRAEARRIKAIGEVAIFLLELITQIQTLAPESLNNQHQAEWWGMLVLECESLGHAMKKEFSGKNELVSWRASQNKQLNGYVNPFTSEMTRRFFDEALPLAERSPDTDKALKRFVKARSALNSKELAGDMSAYRLSLDGKDERIRQGRKKAVPTPLTQ